MVYFDADQLTSKQHYKFLTGSVIPRPIAWITTQSKDGVLNAAPFSYFTIASKEPPLLVLSINHQVDGSAKDTAANLLQTKEAVIQIASEGLAEEMNTTAASLPASESELAGLSLQLATSEIVHVPGISDAPIRLEVILHQHIPLTDEQGTAISDLFLVKVVGYHFSEDVFDIEKEYLIAEKIHPLARLAGNEYGRLGETFSLRRPK